jgi:hypothetical protein
MNAIGKRSSIHTSIFLIAMLVVTLLGATPASAAAETFTFNDRSPVDIEVGVPPCTGAEGLVQLSGYVHTVLRGTSDGAGGFHVIGHNNYESISGITSSGDKYQAVGIIRVNVNGKVGMEYNFIDKFMVIAQGSGNNFLVTETFHFTVNANGTITASHDSFRMECI